MLKPFLLVATAILMVDPALAARDRRSDDAVTAFGDLCVSVFIGKEKSDVDPTRFSVTEITEQTARKIKPDVKGTLWDVSGTKSDVHMLVHYEPTGMCVVEVAEADEAAIRAEFQEMIQKKLPQQLGRRHGGNQTRRTELRRRTPQLQCGA